MELDIIELDVLMNSYFPGKVNQFKLPIYLLKLTIKSFMKSLTVSKNLFL